MKFSPLYDLNHCRYGVYWNFKNDKNNLTNQ